MGKLDRREIVLLPTIIITAIIAMGTTAVVWVKPLDEQAGMIDTSALMMKQTKNFTTIEQNSLHNASLPNDPSLNNQWGIFAVHADAAWENGYYGQGVVVAVFDTGCDLDHPDLKNNLWVNEAEQNGTPGVDDDGNGRVDDIHGWNFVDQGPGDNNIEDTDGHGTHVAGIIAAEANNGIGIAGVAPQAKLMILRVLTSQGGSWGDLGQAARYAQNNGAKVYSLSLGGSIGPLEEAGQIIVENIYNSGGIIVAAAGNESTNFPTYPAAYELIIGVGATEQNNERAPYSNYGFVNVEVCAPGSGIYSTWKNNGYMSASGTSMAAPHVSGVVALLLSKYPEFTPYQVREMLHQSATDLGMPGQDEYFGYGLVNAQAALDVPLPPPNPLSDIMWLLVVVIVIIVVVVSIVAVWKIKKR